FELLQRIRKGERNVSTMNDVVVKSAVQKISQPRAQTAGYGKIGSIKRIPVTAIQDVGGRRRCPGQGNELVRLTPIQRQFQNAGIFHDLADACIPRFHQRRICLHLDALGYLTDLEGDVDNRIASYLQYDTGLYEAFEPRQRCFQTIWTDRQVW